VSLLPECTPRTQPAQLQVKPGTKQAKRGPVFRATKDQINRAQALLKSRGFYAGETVGKLDDATREGLRKYQQAEGLKGNWHAKQDHLGEDEHRAD
jgi:peptidoglycan hydrolase-like protein with peptidoglycan-binding domain